MTGPGAVEPRVADVAAAVGGAEDRAAEGQVLARVRVPATSANLGPGYDALGVALDVPLVAAAGPRQEARVIATGFGEGELPTGDENLVWRGVLAWCERAGTTPPEVSVHVRSAIPLERGMGSSSAAAVAGLLLGRALTGGRATAEQVLALATALEGHPDNAAAAIMGGLVLCLPDGSVRRVNPDEGLRPVLLVPASRQRTSEARGVLPASVPLGVAAGNAARAMATFAGLAGLVPLTVEAMRDELHEPPRLAIMGASGALVEGLRQAGVPAALSGAGPSVLAVVARADRGAVDAVTAVVEGLRGELGVDVEVVPTSWDLSGAVTSP